MANLGAVSKYAIHNDEESLTEQEHIESCDINHMMSNILNGREVRGSTNQAIYGHDDITMDGLTHRMKKAQAEKELEEIAQNHEFTEEELKHMPDSAKQKFKFKTKAKTQASNPTVDQNDKNKTNEQNDQGTKAETKSSKS